MHVMIRASLALAAAAAALAGDPAGLWKMTADAPDNRTYHFQLKVGQQEGKLSAQILSDRQVPPLEEVAFANDELTFRLPHQEAGYVVFRLKVDGAAIKGTLTTRDGDRGTVTGSRVADGPAGTWRISARNADGSEIKAKLDLKQDSNRLSGRLTTQDGETVDISEAAADGSEIRFKILTDDGSYEVTGSITGDQMLGKYKTPRGATGTFTASRTS